jgi:hypothetical protein
MCLYQIVGKTVRFPELLHVLAVLRERILQSGTGTAVHASIMSCNCVTKSVGKQAAFPFHLLSLDSPRMIICFLECPVKCERHTKFSFHVNLVLRVRRRLAFCKCNTTLPTDRQICKHKHFLPSHIFYIEYLVFSMFC